MPRWARPVLAGASGRWGSGILLVIVLVALLGPSFAPYPPTEIGLGTPGAGPTSGHLLGTDTLGRDVFSRLLDGGRSIVFLPAASILWALFAALCLGLWAGYRGGVVDAVITRITDIALSIPPLLIVLVIVSGLGSSNLTLIFVVGLFFVPRITRIIRGATQTTCSNDWVVAARLRGESTASILLREILPNISGVVIAEAAIRLNHAIIFIATLNFLGLGVQPPDADWGLMVSEGRIVLAQAPLVTLAPALAVALLAIGVNLVASELSSHLTRVNRTVETR